MIFDVSLTGIFFQVQFILALFIKGRKWSISGRACATAFNDTQKFAILIELAKNRPIYQMILAVFKLSK